VRPLFGAKYPLPLSAYIEILARVSITQTLWNSWRLRGRVIVGRGSRLYVHRTARVEGPQGWTLVVGMTHDARGGAVVRMRPRSRLTVGGRVQIMRTAEVQVGYDAQLSLGAGTFVNDGALVYCGQSIEIGSDCAISWGVRILDTDVHQLITDGQEQPHRAPVRIGDHCWLGAGATVLKGTVLGQDCVVAAAGVVTGTFGPGVLVSGIPGRPSPKPVTWRH
jgi:acetyltransferase-like isoleucine patch superfamily enzyme